MTPLLIQILRWLIQPKVWRFVGFASAFVGLLCYALGSSFNHLFGGWNLMKIFLYSVFSFTVCFMILYARIWQHSTSLRFKAHTAFLVFTITTVYSFLSDKVMNGKPDAYSLISCAAFAIMSLDLSRQIHCGFEVDLLYFFLGCLIVQLMKIKLELVIVGFAFSYCLLILRLSFPEMDAPREDEYLGLEDEHSVVIEIDSPQVAGSDIASMMQQLSTCLKALQQQNSCLIDRLFVLVKIYSKQAQATLPRSDFEKVKLTDALPSGKINDLQESAKLMLDAGFEKEFLDMYISWRREFLQECLINKLFGLQDINIENECERVEFVDMLMRRWITASEVALRILFPIEKELCNRVFSGFLWVGDHCFREVTEGATFQLLIFADEVADERHSTWCLFKMLAMFETMHYLLPKLQSLFRIPLANEAVDVKNRLGEASRDLFMELHNMIFYVPKQVAPADGQCHPMTVQVMNYLASACRSQGTLVQILESYPNVAKGVGKSSPFTAQMKRIMVRLETKLIAKSKKYTEPALRYLFMINNRSHIEAINKSRGLGTIFGDDWFQENQAEIHRDRELFQRSSWNKVLDFLEFDDNESMASNDNFTADLLKDRLSLFNRYFQEICKVQTTWSMYDKKLREEIIISVGKILLPAYEIFIGRFRDFFGNQAYKYIKYGMFEIQYRLDHLFVGN